MIKNYFKTAVRNFRRYKGFSLINVTGLSIGIAGCLIISLFVWDEMQYDTFAGSENIYRIFTITNRAEGSTSTASVSPVFAPHLKQRFPEVENTLRILMAGGKMLTEAGSVTAYEEKWLMTDPSFFDFFPLKFLSGDPKTALLDPASVVITADMAKKYFGNTDPMGKTLKINKSNVLVKGVIENVPEHFHLDFNYIIPLSAAGIPKERMERWQWQQFFTYIKLRPGTNPDQLQQKFQQDVKRVTEGLTEDSRPDYVPFFQQLKHIHLRSSEFSYDNAKRGNETYVKGLVAIALFVLVIACFNFINLATARSVKRSKEIGVRKVIGASRKQLILQFTTETIFLSVLSMILATLVVLFCLPLLNSFTGKHIAFNPLTSPLTGAGLLAAGLIIGILAGIYPALILSGFKPVNVLKGSKGGTSTEVNTVWLRQGLVVIQFALSSLLIISATIVYKQIHYLHTADLGFNKDEILYFPVKGSIEKNTEAFKTALKQSQNVISVTGGYGLPGDAFAGDGVTVPGKDGDKSLPAKLFIVDHDYIGTLGLELVAGRNFSRNMATDIDEAFIINEAAVKEYGFVTPENALNKPMNWQKWGTDSVKKGRIIGVIRDFHYKSLHEKVSATVLQIYPPVLSTIAVKINAKDVPGTLAHIQEVWKKFVPDYPLDYKFMNENFASMYRAEDKLGSLLWIFTLMAITVGCLGLLGLAASGAEQRAKEIGIRKTLGADTFRIISMLCRSFLKPVLIASFLAFPVAWLLMDTWLQSFPYRVRIDWWIFGLAGMTTLIVALFTVSYQAIKAALTNPVNSLRSE